MIRTGEQYLESLRDGRVVYVGGELIDDVTTHPKTRAYAARTAEFYDMHHDPELQDLMTFVDDQGERRAMIWYRQVDHEGLVRKRTYLEAIIRKFDGGSTPRTPAANNTCLITYVDDPQPWSDQSIGTGGRDLTAGIREFYQLVQDNDYNCVPAFIDPQVDRSKDRTQVDSPALRVVSTNDDGIIVRGVKAVATGVPFADFIHLGVFVRPGMPGEEVIYGAVPVATPGVTVISREATVKDDPVNHPLASHGDELDCSIIFEDVLIPWKYVFHIGNPEHAALYPQRVFDWIHYEALVRQYVRAELMLGLALLMTAHIGTYQLPPVQVRLAKLVEFHQVLRAFVIASEIEGFHSPSGLFKPDPLLFNMGRAHYLENVKNIVGEVIDLAGRASLLFPSEEQWNEPALHDWLEQLHTGATGRPHDRVQISRAIRDLFLTDWGDRLSTFEQFNGSPLLSIRTLTMKRADISPTGSIADLAREVCGLSAESDAKSAYESQAEYARRLDSAAAR
ncbi:MULTISPECIES: 4-hydroxyphenylacetate 3-hydroxylase N-terminal domain-containing protein [unclassified Nocardioides]|uniref:4-hydroxyphenylacetate 3-hydroxylase N-terminal domain-containing protein n=1 Tax=unclassified Nocardioides TaxID=2615069 RepID=UPI0009F085BD|nr:MULTISPECIES: 4-hydroxyphenylacetate 3-hydroxylase N-terminal domain-containing protein [unclassified Nocardioides]GAW47986.1 4-hydroxyphenylacetate 3-hydroxylase [Nocardioides sp. PD653-B2]GAW53711.1 4-hydroxyphenylacetate 3-hydroxylase [Nocardioides sp. PD653]